jgi:imidazolonepropionase-like amidohydrolase
MLESHTGKQTVRRKMSMPRRCFMIARLITVFTTLSAFASLHAQRAVIHAGALIDGLSDSPRTEITLIVENGKIAAIEPGFSPLRNSDTVYDFKKKFAAHAHGAEGAKRAIRAGVASIEHGTHLDEEAFALMKKHGTYWVPTITAGKSVADSAKIPGYYHELVVPKALEIGPKIQGTFAHGYKSGVAIAFGTDAGVFRHGKNAKEFEYLVEAGMPPLAAIKSATYHSARLLGILDKLGTLEVGKIADLIAVEADPLQDIRALQSVSFVMKEGVVYKNE